MNTLFQLGRQIIDAPALLDAWTWLINEMNARPTKVNGSVIFDHKSWSNSPGQSGPLQICSHHVEHVAALYLLTQFGSLNQVIDLTNHGISQQIEIYTDKIEKAYRDLISNQSRFRHALSEHLSFWVYLAVAAKQPVICAFARSQPNRQPEQQGPDGISIALGDPSTSIAIVEVHSVKSSCTNPSALVATSRMKKKGQATSRSKLLDGFWYTAHEGDSIIQLADYLSNVHLQLEQSTSVHLTPFERLRIALLSECVYNATIVADNGFANIALFTGFEYVVEQAERRVATFIGSTDWKQFAAEVQQRVIGRLKVTGAW